MEKYNSDEAIKLLDKINIPRDLGIVKGLTVIWWAFFNKKKLYKFLNGIEEGKMAKFAFDDAK